MVISFPTLKASVHDMFRTLAGDRENFLPFVSSIIYLLLDFPSLPALILLGEFLRHRFQTVLFCSNGYHLQVTVLAVHVSGKLSSS